MRKTISIFIIAITHTFGGYGQDCNAPITLCSGTAELADASQFSGAFNGTCFTALNSLFYEFTTNNNAANTAAFLPYNVLAEIEVISCLDAGVGLDVTAGMYLPDPTGDACGPLTEVAPCATDQNQVVVSSSVLQPNTTYVLVIGIDPATAGFVCDLDIVLTGAPLEINACCSSNIAVGESVLLQAFGATIVSGSENYVLDNPGSLDDFQSQSPVASPTNSTIYTVEGEVGDCLVTDEVTINVQRAINPANAMTPNNDGSNDTWRIGNIQNFDSALISVYDRWGQLVFKSIGYTQPWDGTNDNGNELSEGTYYYVIELNSLVVESEPVTGYVVIIR